MTRRDLLARTLSLGPAGPLTLTGECFQTRRLRALVAEFDRAAAAVEKANAKGEILRAMDLGKDALDAHWADQVSPALEELALIGQDIRKALAPHVALLIDGRLFMLEDTLEKWSDGEDTAGGFAMLDAHAVLVVS